MKAMRNEVKRALELSVVIAFFIYVWNVVGVSEIPESSFNRYGEGWTFSYNGQEKVIDIPVRQKVDAGDTYEISHVVSWELPSDVCKFRKNCASVPEERSAIPLQTAQSSTG